MKGKRYPKQGCYTTPCGSTITETPKRKNSDGPKREAGIGIMAMYMFVKSKADEETRDLI